MHCLGEMLKQKVNEVYLNKPSTTVSPNTYFGGGGRTVHDLDVDKVIISELCMVQHNTV